MIDKKFILFSALFISVAGGAYAGSKPGGEPHSVVVNSTVRNQSAMTFGDKLQFSKTFNVVVVNGGSKSLDLQAGCFKAVMPDKVELTVDAIEKNLTTGILKSGASLKGFISFSSPDDSVYSAQAVKFLPSCK